MTKLAIFFVPLYLFAQAPTPNDQAVLLPNGWSLSPAGEQLAIGDLPLNAALSADERFLAITHSGQSKAEVMLDIPYFPAAPKEMRIEWIE